MKCTRCGKEAYNHRRCDACIRKWTDMRATIWETLTIKYGKFSPENIKEWQKETRKLENIWKKDETKFTEAINKIHMTDCYFIPSKESSSATICANCGQEKMVHTAGEGLKASKVIMNFTQEEQTELQRLSTIIHYKQPTYDDLEKADALSRKKIGYQQSLKPVTLTRIPHKFKKILVKKDGSTWHLSNSEVKDWEKAGSISPGDILYRIVTDTLY